MGEVKFVKVHEDYTSSYCETFDIIASEKKYLARTTAFSYQSVRGYLKDSRINKIPSLLVIDTDIDKVVGWCDVQPKGNRTGILGIALLADYREKGIGTKLIKQILKDSKKLGFKAIELAVRENNIRAINTYKSIGFIKTGMIKDGLKLEEIIENVIIMELKLI